MVKIEYEQQWLKFKTFLLKIKPICLLDLMGIGHPFDFMGGYVSKNGLDRKVLSLRH